MVPWREEPKWRDEATGRLYCIDLADWVNLPELLGADSDVDSSSDSDTDSADDDSDDNSEDDHSSDAFTTGDAPSTIASKEGVYSDECAVKSLEVRLPARSGKGHAADESKNSEASVSSFSSPDALPEREPAQ
jgi:hypothetical protein